MAAREPIFEMTFLKSTFRGELISGEMWDLERKKPRKFNIYVLLAST